MYCIRFLFYIIANRVSDGNFPYYKTWFPYSRKGTESVLLITDTTVINLMTQLNIFL